MPRKRPSARDVDALIEDMYELLARLKAPGKRSNSIASTVAGDILVRSAGSTKPDGYPSSSSAEGVVLTKPASQSALRTHPDEAKPPPHEKGFVEDTSVERIAEQRLKDVCEDCQGYGGGQYTGAPGPLPRCKTCGGTGRRWADPIGEAGRDFVAALVEMRRWAAVAQKKSDIVLHAADNLRGRQSTLGGDCGVCNRFVVGVGDEQLRGQMCPDCKLVYDSWKLDHPTSSDPSADRAEFKRYMQSIPKEVMDTAIARATEWDSALHVSRGPADGEDRRAQ